MSEHVLKTEWFCWNALRAGIKTAEFRKNDRGFRIGDDLLLECLLPDGSPDTKREPLRRRISHIVLGPAFGIPEGYALLSFQCPWGDAK